MGYFFSNLYLQNIKDYSTWEYICWHEFLTEQQIELFQNKLDWDAISCCQILSESIIEKFKHKLNWDNILRFQALSESFIEKQFKYKNKDLITRLSLIHQSNNTETNLDLEKRAWKQVNSASKLSENFLRDHIQYLNWYAVSKYQPLSDTFIRDFYDKLHWNYISTYQKLSNDIITEFSDKIYFIKVNDSWHYKDIDFKKEQVVKTGLYLCKDDYFIAYKSIRPDRYSFYNFQYQYLPNNVYETWADTSNSECSFGFSAWDKKGTESYYTKGIIVPVKIYYSDVARVLSNGGIRCFKIEVLE